MHSGGRAVAYLCPISIKSVPQQAVDRVIGRISLFNRVGVNTAGSAIGISLHSKNDILICLHHFNGEILGRTGYELRRGSSGDTLRNEWNMLS